MRVLYPAMSAAKIAANLRGILAFSGRSVILGISRIRGVILAQILSQADGASFSYSLRQDIRTRAALGLCCSSCCLALSGLENIALAFVNEVIVCFLLKIASFFFSA